MDKTNSRYKIITFLNNNKSSKPLAYFIIMFIISFVTLYFTLIIIKDSQIDLNNILSETLVEKYVNKRFGSGKQSRFEVLETENQLVLYTIYYDKKNEDGSLTQKHVSINLLNESYIPLIFLLSLFFATPIPLISKIPRTFWGVLVLEIYIMLKFAALFFDNYSYPEFELVKIDGIVGGIVFYYNKLLKSVGNGINYLIVAFIWLSFSGIAMKLLDGDYKNNS